MKKALLIVPLLALILLLPAFAEAALVDDRYHFNDYASNPNVADYGEWWFFNFYQPDIKGVIQYSLWDPTGATPYSFGLMYVSVQRNNSTLDMFFPIPWDYVATSDSSADLVMGPETISVNDGAYTISGYVADMQGNEVAWNLQYMQQLPSVDGIRQLKTDLSNPDEEMNWYVQMPSAVVYGAIVVNGETVMINGARGYHDHNWGPWKLSNTVWNWFQTSTPNSAIVGYDFYALNKGQITVQLNDKTIAFKKSQYFVVNYDWITTTSLVPGLPLRFPRKTAVVAFNSEYILLLNVKVQVGETGYVARDYPESGAIWVVLESNAQFTGTLIGHHTCERINSVGFREYAIDIPIPLP
jgi:hypothetical protein